MDAKTVAQEDRSGQTKPVGFWEAFWFWVKLGFINFGGPAGQIAIMHRELVERKRWVSEKQYLRTLNFCMLLPGPEAQQVATYIGWRLTQYVGFIGAWNDPGPFAPLLYGTLGALVTTYATFLPCFLFIFFLAPYIELLANDLRLRAILIGVTAAVVGVIANLAVYFATQVLFPDGFSWGGLDVFALVVAAVSFVVLQRYKVPIYLMVPVGAVLGMAWTLL